MGDANASGVSPASALLGVELPGVDRLDADGIREVLMFEPKRLSLGLAATELLVVAVFGLASAINGGVAVGCIAAVASGVPPGPMG